MVRRGRVVWQTSDGYYKAASLDPEGKRVEIVVGSWARLCECLGGGARLGVCVWPLSLPVGPLCPRWTAVAPLDPCPPVGPP